MKDNKISLTIPMFPLFLLFLILKLAGAITWSWLWVCAPLWIPLSVLTIIFTVGLIAFTIGFVATLAVKGK